GARSVFFSSRRRHTRWPRDWSSDVCSSDLSNKQTTEPAVPIRKAIPVEPQEKKEPVEVRRAQPVKPLDQENEDETLLKSATPPQIGRASCRERLQRAVERCAGQ